MKFGSLALSAAVLLSTNFIGGTDAQARHRFCQRFPDSLRCEEFDFRQAAREDMRREAERLDDDFEDEDDEEEIVRRPRRVDRSCRGIARWLAVNNGFRRIEATDCQGVNFGYRAVRGPWVYLVKVDSRRLRVISTVRLNRF